MAGYTSYLPRGASLSPKGNLGEQRAKEVGGAFHRPIKGKGTTDAQNKLNKMSAPRLAVEQTAIGSLPGSAGSCYPLHDKGDYSGKKAGKG